VTPSGSQPTTTTLTITTSAPTSATLRSTGFGPQAVYALLLPVLGLVSAARGKHIRRGLRMLGLFVLLVLTLALTSCGSGGGSGVGSNTGTPASTSTVTVTAGVTSGTSQTAILTLTVTP